MIFKKEIIELNFDFNFNKENINTNANFSSNFFNEKRQTQILDNLNNSEKNTNNNFENYPFEELIKYDNSKKENIPESDPFKMPDYFQKETINNANFYEAPQTFKTPFVLYFFFYF